MHVRQAGPGDEAAVAALIQELGRSVDFPSLVTEDLARQYLEFPGCYALLAEEGGRAVGLLVYSIQPDLFHAANGCMIRELVVEEHARDRGIGSALMAEVLRRAEAAGCVEVSVSALADNEGALRFYRSFGLTDEAVFLEKHLD